MIAIFFIIIFYNIDIVHARSRAPAWSCLIATKLSGRKFVTTFHGTYNFGNRFKKFYNSVMVRSHLVIAGSNFIFSHINDNYGKFFLNKKRKLLVIFRGINTSYFNSQKVLPIKIDKFAKKHEIDRNKLIFVMPGRLTYWKGQKIFIEAIRLIMNQENTQPFEAIILGHDQGRNVYKKQLLPEACGRISVEAQSMEVPIVASDIGGSRETIIKDKTGFLFKNKDANDLANTMAMLMQKDYNSIKSIGLAGRKNVLKKFDVDKMCKTTFTEYKKLIELS